VRGGRHGVDVRLRDAAVVDRVQRRLGVELQSRPVRDDAELVGLGRPDDRHLAADAHEGLPDAGRKTGMRMFPREANATSRSMSSSSLSGLGSTSTRLAIIRGPSSSSTIAITYGASASKPGAARWLIT